MVNLRDFIKWYNLNSNAINALTKYGESPIDAGMRIYREFMVDKPESILQKQEPSVEPKPVTPQEKILDTSNPATSKEPTPKGSGINIVDLVKDDIEARAVEGEKTYGERLKAFNGRSGLTDAYQEAVDLTVYLRQVLEERKKVVALAHQIKLDLRSELMPYFGEGSRGLAYLNKSIEALEEISIIIK